jgi:hypothetical protein
MQDADIVVPFSRCAVAAVVAGLLAAHGLRKKSLSVSGGVAAFVVGFVHWSEPLP